MPSTLTVEDKGFIRAILDQPEELTTWLVYADWLDDRADPRAEFLRLTVQSKQLTPDDPLAEELNARLTVLRRELDPNWTLVFDTPHVENCPSSIGWLATCPMTWNTLAPTDEPDIRLCNGCRSLVFFCTRPDEAREFAARGQRVALSTLTPDEQNPFLTRNRAATGEFDTDEFLFAPDEVVPEGDLETVELPWPDPALEYPPPPPEPPTPPPRRPWWKFW